MPCLDYLAQVREACPRITALGVRVVAVGSGSPAQARRLAQSGMPFPCLVDRERRLHAALGLGRLGLGGFSRLDVWAGYARALLRGSRPGARTGSWRQQSGVALFDAQARLVWIHRASRLGDYPGTAGILDVLQSFLARREGAV